MDLMPSIIGGIVILFTGGLAVYITKLINNGYNNKTTKRKRNLLFPDKFSVSEIFLILTTFITLHFVVHSDMLFYDNQKQLLLWQANIIHIIFGSLHCYFFRQFSIKTSISTNMITAYFSSYSLCNEG